jgi:hypothetical protein
MPRTISSATSLDTLRKEAKRWLRAIRDNNPDARARFERACPGGPHAPVLRDVQHALAREFDVDGWIALTHAVRRSRGADPIATPLRSAAEYEQAADDMVRAYGAQDREALDRLNAHTKLDFSFDDLKNLIWRRVYAFRQRSFKGEKSYITREEAMVLLAQDAGFSSWSALTRAIATGAPRTPPWTIDAAENVIAPRRVLNDREWDALIAVARERGITGLDSNGLMTDAVMARVAALEQITRLSLGGSQSLTNEGLRQLARMPQMQRLDLSAYPGGTLNDSGLEVLRHLPRLRWFEMTWQKGITDAGIANLRSCDALEHVNLMGSPTGDGAIAALEGKANLRSFSTGRLVTDEGVERLRHFPRMTTPDGDGAHLLIDGPFTNAGLANLAGLDGVTELDLFWHVTRVTAAGFVHLAALPNLVSLGADGELSNDEAMGHIAAIPRLKRLRAQGATATDAGFEALCRSRTLENLWGRECEHFGTRGFLALSTLPALRGFGISCRNVADEALATLPQFPALRELTPIGFSDQGFRHIGRCERIDRLTCMYCRTTTDAATAYIKDLPLLYYYAGLTQITDRSLEILGGMSSLEVVDLYECQGISDAGLIHLAGLPHLREVNIDGMQRVTLEGTRVFPARVRVRYNT